MTSEIIELDGKQFVSADQMPLPEWLSVLNERPQPILTLKDDDLFLLTDTFGNIGGTAEDGRNSSLGLFCSDTRFLNRLELQIEGRPPVLLSSTAEKGFVLSVLCTNSRLGDKIPAETIGLKRELVLNGGLFEEMEIANYSTEAVSFEISLSFDADFIDLFEIRGFARNQRGQLLRRVSGNLTAVTRGGDASESSEFGGEAGLAAAIAPDREMTEELTLETDAFAMFDAGQSSAQSDPWNATETVPSGWGHAESSLQTAQALDPQASDPQASDPQASGLSASGLSASGLSSELPGFTDADESERLPIELTLAYQCLDGQILESQIEFVHTQPDALQGHTAVWRLHLQSHETRKIGYRLYPLSNGRSISQVSAPMTLAQAKAAESAEEQTWRQQATQIRTDNGAFNRIIERSQQDVYLLRQTFGKGKALSAGVPWFSTLFGRDSIIAAAQTLLLDPQIARETLMILAYYQGKADDEWREEQPGKMLHEIRFGEMSRCREIPHTPYYGTVDATPLWLMLYAEYFDWTADYETLDRLWSNALAAMDWIDRNLKTTGYLSYERTSKRGLDNQGWKDSGDCIVDRRGQMAQGSIALCEVQGYVYAAKMRLSQIARMKKRIDLADRWEEEARELKLRFNRDFWMEDQDFCALALDGQGKQVDSITSNPGHCLALGIFTPEKAYSVAERLRAPDMFNGWGIRTLSSLSPAYNPMGYHTGSVWPHDNALIAVGMRSLGLIDQSLELCKGLLDMTHHQPYQRPPELFCGYDRLEDNDPVQYPVACSPQAWATGSVFQLIHMIVNLVPDVPGNCLRVIDPALPESLNYLALKNLRVGPTLLDLEFERSGDSTSCRVSKKRGNLRVIIEA